MNLRRKKPFIIFTISLMVIIILHYSGVIKPLENFLLYISKPLTSSFYNLSVNTNRLAKESRQVEDPNLIINKLQAEVASLMILKSESQEIVDENRRLKELLGFINENEFQLVLAGIIAQENVDQDSRDLIINKGSLNGLTEGLAVVNEQGILIGKIIEVKDSILELFAGLSLIFAVLL